MGRSERHADTGVSKMLDNFVTDLLCGQNDKEHVKVAGTILGNYRKGKKSVGFEWCEGAAIMLVDLATAFGDAFDFFKLSVEEGTADFTGDV